MFKTCRHIKKAAAALLSFLMCFSVFAAGGCEKVKEFRETQFVFGAISCTLRLYGKNPQAAGEEIFSELKKLDRAISTQPVKDLYEDGSTQEYQSPVFQFNNKTDKTADYRVEIDRHLYNMAVECMEAYNTFKAGAAEGCDYEPGLFNPAIYPLMELWGLTAGKWDMLLHIKEPLPAGSSFELPAAGEYVSLPTLEEVREALKYCDYSKIKLSEEVVEGQTRYYLGLYEGEYIDKMQIDFGGYAKGYAADLAAEICAKYNLKGGIINLSGNVYCFGENVRNDGRWLITVGGPFGSDFCITNLPQSTVVTSGLYERKYYINQYGIQTEDEDADVIVPHIIDPRTGIPVNLRIDATGGNYIYSNTSSAVCGATIIEDSSAYAELFSTMACLLPIEEGIELLRGNSVTGFIISWDERYAVSGDIRLYRGADDYRDYWTLFDYERVGAQDFLDK